MSIFKQFTKAQYNALTNEIVRLAKDFTKNGFDSSVSFGKDNATLFVHGDNECICIIYVRRDRYINRNEYNDLVNASIRANVSLNGRYVGMMRDAINNESDDSKEYIDY